MVVLHVAGALGEEEVVETLQVIRGRHFESLVDFAVGCIDGDPGMGEEVPPAVFL